MGQVGALHGAQGYASIIRKRNHSSLREHIDSACANRDTTHTPSPETEHNEDFRACAPLRNVPLALLQPIGNSNITYAKILTSGGAEMGEPDYKRVVSDILIDMFNDILRVEHKAIEALGMMPLSMSELHIIEAVGDNNGNCIMSDIAHRLRITLPTLTAAADRLEEKGYIQRHRSSADRRRVSVTLTQDGGLAYRRHAEFHTRMVDAFLEGLERAKVPELISSMTKLRDFFQEQIGKLDDK
jgi:DNA-binding MarR family transcriptional regulator